MNNIHEKLYANPNSIDISKRIDKMIKSIDYEVDKYRDTRASVIFTGNLHPSSLFTMASHAKYSDLTHGINNIKQELEYIKSNYGLDLKDDICEIFYEKFAKVAAIYLDSLSCEHSDKLKSLIINRAEYKDIRLFQEMHKLISEVDGNEEITKIIRIILEIDPVYEVLCENQAKNDSFTDAYSLHNINTKELNIDFIDHAINYVTSIYQQVFGTKNIKEQSDKTSSDPRP